MVEGAAALGAGVDAAPGVVAGALGIRIVAPAKIWFGLVIPLAAASAATVVPYRVAMALSVSPGRTVVVAAKAASALPEPATHSVNNSGATTTPIRTAASVLILGLERACRGRPRLHVEERPRG